MIGTLAVIILPQVVWNLPIWHTKLFTKKISENNNINIYYATNRNTLTK